MGRSLLGAISAASVVLAAASFKAVLDDPPKEGDPPAWIFYASSVAAAGLAALAVAFALRGRRALSLAALLTSIALLVGLWTLAALFGG
jgi:hypothetical protein